MITFFVSAAHICCLRWGKKKKVRQNWFIDLFRTKIVKLNWLSELYSGFFPSNCFSNLCHTHFTTEKNVIQVVYAKQKNVFPPTEQWHEMDIMETGQLLAGLHFVLMAWLTRGPRGRREIKDKRGGRGGGGENGKIILLMLCCEDENAHASTPQCSTSPPWINNTFTSTSAE